MAAIDSALNGLLKLALPVAAIAAGALAVVAVLDRMAVDQHATERRALMQRSAELSVGALAPGSALACLDGSAGEAIENACEKLIFADPQSAAAAVAYTAARLALLADAAALAQNGDAALTDTFAAARRAVELDRFGLAAHVLANRDGCTAERCAAFAWLRDAGVVKANLKAQAFDTYVARYAAAWTKAPALAEKQPPQAAAPVAGAPEQPAASGQPALSKYDFPSAASIPPVSIMNPEPALPKGDAQAGQPEGEGAAVPVPPKRPQAQAATPPARQ